MINEIKKENTHTYIHTINIPVFTLKPMYKREESIKIMIVKVILMYGICRSIDTILKYNKK